MMVHASEPQMAHDWVAYLAGFKLTRDDLEPYWVEEPDRIED